MKEYVDPVKPGRIHSRQLVINQVGKNLDRRIVADIGRREKMNQVFRTEAEDIGVVCHVEIIIPIGEEIVANSLPVNDKRQ